MIQVVISITEGEKINLKYSCGNTIITFTLDISVQNSKQTNNSNMYRCAYSVFANYRIGARRGNHGRRIRITITISSGGNIWTTACNRSL
jgi:hypothetical protein